MEGFLGKVERNWVIAVALSFLLVGTSPAHSGDAPAYPDIWGRSLVELGIIPAEPRQRIDLGIGVHEVYKVDDEIVIEVGTNRDNNKIYRVHFFIGLVTESNSRTPAPPNYRRVKNNYSTIKSNNIYISAGRECSRGSALMGKINIKQDSIWSFKYLAYRRYTIKDPGIIDESGDFLECQESKEQAPPDSLPFLTWNPIESHQPEIVDLGDGSFLAWSLPIDIIRFRLDGTTPYRPRDIAILDGREVDDLLAKSSYEPRKVHAALDALLKSRGY